jgi:hypothetical protein
MIAALAPPRARIVIARELDSVNGIVAFEPALG